MPHVQADACHNERLMLFGLRKRKRFERVASLELPPGQWERAWISLRHRDVLGRIALALLAAASLCSVIHGWNPPFAFSDRLHAAARHRRHGDVHEGRSRRHAGRPTTGSRDRRDTSTLAIPSRWCSCGRSCGTTLVELTAAPTLDKLDPKLWDDFQLPPPKGATPPTAKEQEEQFRKFRAAFTPQESLGPRREGHRRGFRPLRGSRPAWTSSAIRTGREITQEIVVYPVGHPEDSSKSCPSARCWSATSRGKQRHP